MADSGLAPALGDTSVTKYRVTRIVVMTFAEIINERIAAFCREMRMYEYPADEIDFIRQYIQEEYVSTAPVTQLALLAEQVNITE